MKREDDLALANHIQQEAYNFIDQLNYRIQDIIIRLSRNEEIRAAFELGGMQEEIRQKMTYFENEISDDPA